MHGLINVKSPNNISKWQMGFNSAFKGLISVYYCLCLRWNQVGYKLCLRLEIGLI
jgi:hypothetical protein